MGRCYESESGGGGVEFYQNTTDTKPILTKTAVSRQKGKVPTTVQCERYEQIAVEAPNGGHPFYISALKDSQKGGVIWMLEEACGQAREVRNRGGCSQQRRGPE